MFAEFPCKIVYMEVNCLAESPTAFSCIEVSSPYFSPLIAYSLSCYNHNYLCNTVLGGKKTNYALHSSISVIYAHE